MPSPMPPPAMPHSGAALFLLSAWTFAFVVWLVILVSACTRERRRDR
jgi:hypothetical protein